MARCDEGYLCDVCDQPVDEITDSDLYLRYVLGEVRFEELSDSPERHIRCNPVQAQFIVADEFEPETVEGVFDKAELDQASVKRRELRTTQAWQRLQDLAASGVPITDYPLPRQ